jgi:hypothetical protein
MPEMEIKLTTNVEGVGVAGQRVTLALTPVDVVDPTEIPTYLAGYKPFAARADEASPVALVDFDLGKYRSFSENDAFRRVPVKGSDQSAVREVDPSSALVDYRLVNRFLGGFVPDQTQEQAVYDAKRAVGRRTMNAIELDREHDVWEMLGTASNWNANVRLAVAAGDEWNVSGDPIYDLQTAVELAWQPVTEIWMNQKVAFAFLRHQEVRAHMRQFYGDSAISNASVGIANAQTQSVDFQIPGLPPIKVVASKEKNESTGRLDYCLGNVVVLTHQPPGIPTDGEDSRSALTFRRRGEGGVGLETREYRIEGRGPKGGVMQVVSTADVNVMPANMAGAIITNVYAADA